MENSIKNCMYCENKEKLDNLVIHIADLPVSKLFLTKEQTYYGRCSLAYKDHGAEITDLSDADLALYMQDVKKAAIAIQKVVCPDKINYGMYSDNLPHIHMHIVPKQRDGYSFGGAFDLHLQSPKYLSDEEYRLLIQEIMSALDNL